MAAPRAKFRQFFGKAHLGDLAIVRFAHRWCNCHVGLGEQLCKGLWPDFRLDLGPQIGARIAMSQDHITQMAMIRRRTDHPFDRTPKTVHDQWIGNQRCQNNRLAQMVFACPANRQHRRFRALMRHTWRLPFATPSPVALGPVRGRTARRE